MATISENLQTLNEVKKAIKTAIENKGQDLTDVLFTQYAEKIEAIKASNKATVKDLIKALSAGYLFYYANSTNEVIASLITYDDTENTRSTGNMFRFSVGITHPPLFDTRNVQNAMNMFNSSEVEVVPAYDFREASSMGGIFNSCSKLRECWLKNIGWALQVGSGSTYGHLLTLESLIHLIKELRNKGSLRTLTVGTVNLEKLANVYVRTIEITDEMRAEDDLIDEKLPFEVCESTDNGAILITSYAALKNWNIA